MLLCCTVDFIIIPVVNAGIMVVVLITVENIIHIISDIVPGSVEVFPEVTSSGVVIIIDTVIGTRRFVVHIIVVASAA